MCGSDGKVYPNSCYLQQASCRRRSSEEELSQAADSVCARTKLQENIICAGCPQEGSQENEDVRAAADFASLALTEDFNSAHYFALDSITEVKTQVVAGTNFFLTIFVGETDCPVSSIERAELEFSKENCTINLEHDNNNLSLHMTETTCARGIRSVYVDQCKLKRFEAHTGSHLISS